MTDIAFVFWKINLNPAREYGRAKIAALTVHFAVTFLPLPLSDFPLLNRALQNSGTLKRFL